MSAAIAKLEQGIRAAADVEAQLTDLTMRLEASEKERKFLELELKDSARREREFSNEAHEATKKAEAAMLYAIKLESDIRAWYQTFQQTGWQIQNIVKKMPPPPVRPEDGSALPGPVQGGYQAPSGEAPIAPTTGSGVLRGSPNRAELDELSALIGQAAVERTKNGTH